jgi:hypothetical protein
MVETHIQDVERNFYMKQLSVTSGNTEDLKALVYPNGELVWLQSQTTGVTNVEDGWVKFLTEEGYSGDLPSMKKKYYEDNL